MKMNKDLRQSYPVEFIDMMTDTGIMALVDWMAETKPGGALFEVIFALRSLREMRMVSLRSPEGLDEADREQLEGAIEQLASASVELTGRVWGVYGTQPAKKKARRTADDIEADLKHSSLEVTTAYLEMTR